MADARIESEQQTALLQRGLRLECTTRGCNVAGAVVVDRRRDRSRSPALGMDSLIEIFASTIVV